MSKLEKLIKRKAEDLELAEYVGVTLTKTEYKWLILQAQKAEELQAKVDELEKEKDEWKDTAQSYYVTNQELREKNQRYKQGLEEVKSLTINPREYQPSTYTIHHIVSDALKGVEG